MSILSPIKKACRRIKARFYNRVLILLYHRIARPRLDPFSLSVSPENFQEHLEVLRRRYTLIQMREIPRLLQKPLDWEKYVCVTFDDGYTDNLTYGRPLLERFHVPATVFVAAGYLGGARQFWWDELTSLFLQGGDKPSALSLRFDGSSCPRNLDAGCYSQDDFDRFASWQVSEPDDPTTRHRVFRSVWQQLVRLPEQARSEALAGIRLWAGDTPEVDKASLPLTVDQLLALAQDDLVEIGAHTVNHPFLPAHSVDNQRREIQSSKHTLETILGKTVDTFSYPFGAKSAETIALVRESCFSCAATVMSRAFGRGVDRWALPRVTVSDCNGDHLAETVHHWFAC